MTTTIGRNNVTTRVALTSHACRGRCTCIVCRKSCRLVSCAMYMFLFSWNNLGKATQIESTLNSAPWIEPSINRLCTDAMQRIENFVLRTARYCKVACEFAESYQCWMHEDVWDDLVDSSCCKRRVCERLSRGGSRLQEATGQRDLETASLMRNCKPEEKVLGIKRVDEKGSMSITCVQWRSAAVSWPVYLKASPSRYPKS